MEEAAPERPRRGAHRRQRHTRRTLLLVVAGLIVVFLAAGLGFVLSRPVPPASASPSRTVLVTAGTLPTPPWPTEGQGAYSVPALGVAASSPGEVPVPIGSVAKMMTALVVLADHPLSPGEDGPDVTVVPSDVAAYAQDLTSDQSNVAISVGEVLTERQLLEGLLVHSGDDYAVILARFDAGSEAAFVLKMNERATSMGLHSTTYADASGFDPKTVSTASDQLVVAAAAMENPTIADIVAMPSVTLPVAGSLASYTPLVGTEGVIGVKSGRTTQAGGCDVLAITRSVGGEPVLVLSAVLGQVTAADRLAAAGQAALGLARSASAAIVPVVVASTTRPVARLGWPSATVGLESRAEVVVPSWPGHRVRVAVLLPRSITRSVPQGAVAALLRAQVGSVRLTAALVTTAALPEPSLLDRLG
jgi:D-alanyl-D-alanine carboxypeptidase (penicillin-binding protein 5/6)